MTRLEVQVAALARENAALKLSLVGAQADGSGSGGFVEAAAEEAATVETIFAAASEADAAVSALS